MDEHEIRITLRLPAKLRDMLVSSAENHSRSMNGEIVARLEESYSAKIRTASPSVEYMEDYLRRLDERLERLHGPLPNDPLPPYRHDQNEDS